MHVNIRRALASLALVLVGPALARDVLIDVRSEAEFQSGHIAGAINLPHGTIGQTIAGAQVSRDDHLILYCRSGRRSGLAMDTLKGLGFSKAENYGGLEQAQKRLQKP
jgi:phage shock protein E